MNELASPFLGRWREIAHLDRALDGARSGIGSVVVIAGEAGIGKSRLAQEFSERARASGALVVWGRSWEVDLGSPAFAPWLEALGSLLQAAASRSGAATLHELFAEFGVPPTRELTDDSGAEDDSLESVRFRLFGRIVELLRAASGVNDSDEAGNTARPVVVVIDDIHWADGPSLLLLRYLARICQTIPVVLVMTYDDEADGRSAQLRGALAAIERESGVSRLDLPGLNEPEVQELAASLLLDRRDPRRLLRLVERVHELTDGNPFFVRELLQALQGADSMPAGAEGVPATVRDVVESRLARLSDSTQQMLRVAAVAGPEFDAWVVDRATSERGELLDRAFDEAEAANFIEPSGPVGHYRFVHALTRNAVYSGFASRSRVRTHRSVAEILEAEYGAGAEDHAAELAYHFGAVGDTERALHYRLEAGERARAATAWEEAARHYEMAAGLLAGAGDRRHEAEVLYVIGRCWRLAGAPRQAWQALMRSMSSFEELGDGAWTARAAVEALAIPASAARRESIARRALATLGPDERRLEARLHLSLVLWSRDSDGESRTRALELARAEGLVDVVAALEQQPANQALLAGRLSDAREQLDQLYRLCLEHGRRGWALRFLTSASSIPVFEGDLAEGESALLRTIAFSDGAHPLWEGGLLTWLAGVALARSDHVRFEELMERARRLHPESFRLSLLRALQREIAGETDEALEVLPGPEETGDYPGWLAIVHGSRARLLHAAGDRDAALDELEQWAQHLRPFNTAEGSPSYLHTLSCVDGVLAAGGSDRLVTLVDSELVQWSWARFAPGNACSLDRMRGDLAYRLGRLDDADASYRAGAEWALREHCEVEVGRCQIGLARVSAARSDGAGAIEHVDRAIRFLRRADAALYLRQALALRDAVAEEWTSEPEVTPASHPVGGADLSPRELEVLGLVADGHTNREIADRLVISVNTVARHVTHIFNKTGVSNRAEAVGYAHRHHLLRKG